MTASPTPQPVTGEQSPAAIFLVVTIDEGGETVAREVVADSAGIARAVGFRLPGAALELVVGIGSDAWDRLFDGPRPAKLHPFREIRGARHVAPATPGDLLFHIRAMSHDTCFELAHRITRRLSGAATVVDEVHGFRYLESRDLTGFVDGTENPTGSAALAVVTVGDEDPRFAGGSYVHVQKYIHDIAAWEALPVPEQEDAIGRTKADDVEMSADRKPHNAHTALTSIEDDHGNPLEILRANLPFGRAGGEMGTYFIGYSRDPAITERMLTNMVVGDPAGNHDRLLDFSAAVTGSAFFVPSVDLLETLPLRQ